MQNKRDYREETMLNAAEEMMLKNLAGNLGLTKAAVLRMSLHLLGDHYMQKEKSIYTVEQPEV